MHLNFTFTCQEWNNKSFHFSFLEKSKKKSLFIPRKKWKNFRFHPVPKWEPTWEQWYYFFMFFITSQCLSWSNQGSWQPWCKLPAPPWHKRRGRRRRCRRPSRSSLSYNAAEDPHCPPHKHPPRKRQIGETVLPDATASNVELSLSVSKQMVLMTMPKVQMTKSKGLKGFQLEVWVRAEGL